MKAIGKIDWAFSAGCIPEHSTGNEPTFTSHDKIAILNTSKSEVLVELMIFYEGAIPTGPYSIKIAPERLKKVRFNDLIDPVPIRLGRPFGCLIRSYSNVVVQFSRLNTGSRRISEMSSMAWPDD